VRASTEWDHEYPRRWRKASAIVDLLVPPFRRASVVLQHVVALPVEAEPALTIAERLDGVLP
jgi:hypothetical protein